MILPSELPAGIFEALRRGNIMAEHFPMLLREGVPDVGVTVHSHFLTFFASLGQSLGYAAVTECPISWIPDHAWVGDVRADSVWFDKKSLDPSVAIEFERFHPGDEAKLCQKIENLALTSLATPSLALCILVYWVRSGLTPKSMDSVVKVYRDGFYRRGVTIPPGNSPLMILKCVMRSDEKSGKLVFSEFLRDERNEYLAVGRF